MEKKDPDQLIVELLKEKTAVKRDVYRTAHQAFETLKKVIQEEADKYNNKLEEQGLDRFLEYQSRTPLEAQLKIAGDMLIFTMHTNVFEFDKNHGVWKHSYVYDNMANSFCGIINVYNFLSDSFKYNRTNDLGYLIARIFINKDRHFIVEGKRQLGFLYNNYATDTFDDESMRSVLHSMLLFTLDFDMFVPPYDKVKIVTVSQMKERLNNSVMQTGKRLGFKFYADEGVE